MTHFEFTITVQKANYIAKTIHEIVGAERYSIGGSMVLELYGKLNRDVHDIDVIYEFDTREKAILAYQLLDRTLDVIGKEHKKSYDNVAHDVWSVEFQTSLLPYPINVLFRERDTTVLRHCLGVNWQRLEVVEDWKRKWNRDKDREDLK